MWSRSGICVSLCPRQVILLQGHFQAVGLLSVSAVEVISISIKYWAIFKPTDWFICFFCGCTMLQGMMSLPFLWVWEYLINSQEETWASTEGRNICCEYDGKCVLQTKIVRQPSWVTVSLQLFIGCLSGWLKTTNLLGHAISKSEISTCLV